MKKILNLSLVLIMVMALVGCVQSGGGESVAGGIPLTDNPDYVAKESNGVLEPIDPTDIGDETVYDWGITLTATDVTSTGMTLVCTQEGGEPTGELSSGSYYWIEQLVDGQYQEVAGAPDKLSIAWTEEGWPIALEDTISWEIDWTGLFEELEPGAYRIEKEVIDVRKAGDLDRQKYYAEFEIENTVEIVGDPRLLTEEELAFFNDNYFDILYEEEGYHVRFSKGTRMGDEVKLIYRGYVPETGDVYEMIEHIITLQQEGENYIYTSYEPAV